MQVWQATSFTGPNLRLECLTRGSRFPATCRIFTEFKRAPQLCPRTSCHCSATSSQIVSDQQYMQRALDLAGTAKGKTHPNPAVGCVLVLDGRIVGEGYHPKAGEPHAEVFALRGAGKSAKGSVAYVTLEPCNHYGRTPPCSLALVEAGVSRVVVGVVDPNPQVAGQGIERLQQAGIEVTEKCLPEACYAMNKEFMERMKAAAAVSG